MYGRIRVLNKSLSLRLRDLTKSVYEAFDYHVIELEEMSVDDRIRKIFTFVHEQNEPS